MIRHLTLADYVTMPWANGLGQTVEIVRVEKDGGLLWRLSMASVVEDGAFSIFAGIERNLTVISGPGFGLEGEGIALACRPLVPVAFAGDVALRATGVKAASEDFNVMTARSLPKPKVWVITGQARAAPPPDGLLCLLALAPSVAGGVAMAIHDLVMTREAVTVEGGPLIAVALAV